MNSVTIEDDRGGGASGAVVGAQPNGTKINKELLSVMEPWKELPELSSFD